MNKTLTAKGDRARQLHDLLDTQGWQELRAIYEEQKERWTRHLATQLLTSDAVIDQREIDYQRGFFDAWRSLLAQPDLAERRFNEALRRREEPS